jgi:hypothetical protein
MKLRIKDDSLHLRLSQTHLRRLLESGRIEEPIYFGPESNAKLTYILQREPSNHPNAGEVCR